MTDLSEVPDTELAAELRRRKAGRPGARGRPPKDNALRCACGSYSIHTANATRRAWTLRGEYHRVSGCGKLEE